jgi:chaperonin cofactor prefoldin|tara:strand:- start:1625 stop:1819 length:195 start_codon:yes stop_codon:yes gene_type:complete
MSQTNESLIRERDFYRSKLESLEKQVQTLGTDYSYLQKQHDSLKLKLKESNEKSFYRTKKFRRN